MITIHLSEALKRLQQDAMLGERADTILREWQHEPLMATMLETPQSPPHHAEGLTVRSHIHRMLCHLYAIMEGRLCLLEIEEFARHKDIADQVQHMENTVREQAATFEVFALLHDIGKPFRVTTDAQGVVHYFGHEKEIFRPEALELLSRLATRYRLTDDDVNKLVPLISFHLEPLKRSAMSIDPKPIHFFTRVAVKERIDPDDFVDLLVGAALLDQTLGSVPPAPQHLINLLFSLAEYAPWKKQKRMEEQALARKREEQKVFRAVGLDGDGLMKMLHLSAGREFGVILKSVQAAAKGEQDVNPAWENEVKRRVQESSRLLSHCPPGQAGRTKII